MTTDLGAVNTNDTKRALISERAPFGLSLYRGLSSAGLTFANHTLNQRLKQGKEDPERIDERRGRAGLPRPEGDLVWIHGASVGESLSVLPLVRRFNKTRPDLKFLVTTGTVTSARLMAERLPENAIHQFIPLDHPQFVENFLDHWRPQAALFVESEFWPNLILKARERTKFMAIVNGRVSPISFERWRKRPKTIRYLLSAFDLIIAQDNNNADRLGTLSGRSVMRFGNLKNAAPPLPTDNREIERLEKEIGDRPIWLAASTHPGEDEVVFDAHKILCREFPDVLTFLAPRHPERSNEIAEIAQEMELNIARRSKNDPITPDTNIYLADTLGELGLFYRLCDISFVGGGIINKGGHNPLEPARLNGAILHGPHIFNFAETYGEMRGAGGAALVRNDRELALAVRRLITDEKTRHTMANTARISAESSAERVLNEISETLLSQLAVSAVKPA